MPELLPAICSIGRCLSSTKTVHQHIALVTQLSFCTVRHPSSSVLICDQPTVVTLTQFDYCIWDMMQKHVYEVPICDTDELWQHLVDMG